MAGGRLLPGREVDIEDAVDAYTIGSAYNEFAEDFKGRLSRGTCGHDSAGHRYFHMQTGGDPDYPSGDDDR